METDWRSWDADTWRSWDRDRLQDEVSPSSMVPGRDISPWLRWYAETGDAAAAATPHGIAEVRYGPHPDEVVSWASVGDSRDPAPLVVFIHGGYWVALSHRDALFAAPAVTRLGAHYASINYTLAPAATLEQIVDQCRRAIRFLLDELPVDRRRIVIAGHSAGGHLAALCAEEVEGAHLLGFSGVYDLEPLLLTTVNEPLGLDRGRALTLSPLHRPSPPVASALLVVGGSDPAHFRSLNARYAACLRASGVLATEIVVDHANHFDVVGELGNPTSPVSAWLRKALDLA